MQALLKFLSELIVIGSSQRNTVYKEMKKMATPKHPVQHKCKKS